MWAAIGKSGMYGPFFVEENRHSNIYLRILEESFWPLVEEKRLEDSIKFMQDGAPPHFVVSAAAGWMKSCQTVRWAEVDQAYHGLLSHRT